MSVIENKDIYDPSQGDPFKLIHDYLDKLDEHLKKIESRVSGSEKSLLGIEKTGNGAEAEKLIKQTQQLATETDKLNAIQKEREKIENELLKAEAKLSELQKESSQKLADIKLQQQQLNQEQKTDAKLRSDKIGAYDKEQIRLTALKKRYKDLAFENKHLSDEGQNLLKTIQELDQKFKDTDESVGENQRKVGAYTQALIPLQRQLRIMTQQLAQMELDGKKNTKEFENLAKKAGELRDAIGDADAQIRLYASDTLKLDQAVAVFQAIGSAAQIAQGAQALLGLEDENLAKSIQKLVAIQSILNGVTEIQNALQKESAFTLALLNIKQKIVTAAQWLWNVALSANPIGAVVAGIALLIGGIVALTKWLESSEEATRKQNTANDGLVLTSKKAVEAHNEHIKVMEDLELELNKASGAITDFQYDVETMTIEYERNVEKIKKTTEEKITKTNSFWSQLFRGFKNLGNIAGTIADQATETANIIADGIQQEADVTEEYEKRLEILRARKEQRDKERAQKELNRIREQNLKEYNENLFKNVEELSLQEEQTDNLNKIILDGQEKLNAQLAENQEAAKLYGSKLLGEQIDQQKLYNKQVKALQEELLGNAISSLTSLAVQGELTAKEFGKIVIGTALDILEKEIEIAITTIWAKSLAGNLLLGIPKAVFLTALVKGLFAGLKAKVQGFAEGADYVNGPGTYKSDSVPAMLSKGEGVAPAKINKQLLALGVGVTDPKLPLLVAAGMNNLQMIALLSSVNRNTNALVKANSGWQDRDYYYIQSWRTGEIERIHK